LDEEIRFSNNNELPTTKCINRECDPIPVVHGNGRNSTQETVMFNGKCTNVTSSEECAGDHEVVFVNPFGEGDWCISSILNIHSHNCVFELWFG